MPKRKYIKKPFPRKGVDWKKLDGRWQLLATTIQSQCVENRVISYSLKNYKKNNPKGKMMNLEEIYPAINFLLDKNNTHTNAQEIFVDGGWLSW